MPLEQASEIDRQTNDVSGGDNARHLRMAGVVTIGHRDPLQGRKDLSDLSEFLPARIISTER